MLVLRSDWQAALPKLTEIGNGLALISSLDVMLGAAGDIVSMQLAPLLGVTFTPGGYMQCLVGTPPVSATCWVLVSAPRGHMQC